MRNNVYIDLKITSKVQYQVQSVGYVVKIILCCPNNIEQFPWSVWVLMVLIKLYNVFLIIICICLSQIWNV